jgi:plastocyanin
MKDMNILFMKINSPLKRLVRSALCAATCWGLGYAPSAPAVTFNVSVQDFAFSPSSTTIKVNDQVTWTWAGAALHTTTSTTGLWDSPLQTSGSFSHTFTSAGSFPYLCTTHTFMTASVTVQSATVPPTVTITNPPNGVILTAPASFTLAATASATGGTVTNVQFFQGTTSLSNRTTLPYSVAVNSLVAGSYTFSAVASSNTGLKATNAITLTVNAPPTANITAPVNGDTFAAPWTGTIHATVGDTDGTVSKAQFFAGASLLGTVINPAASPSLNVTNLAAGNYILKVVATDNHGATNTSALVNISVVTPSAIVLSSARRVSATAFQFDYTADPGLSYVIRRSAGTTSFTPTATNKAASSPVTFLDNGATGAMNFYRAQLLPNP